MGYQPLKYTLYYICRLICKHFFINYFFCNPGSSWSMVLSLYQMALKSPRIWWVHCGLVRDLANILLTLQLVASTEPMFACRQFFASGIAHKESLKCQSAKQMWKLSIYNYWYVSHQSIKKQYPSGWRFYHNNYNALPDAPDSIIAIFHARAALCPW